VQKVQKKLQQRSQEEQARAQGKRFHEANRLKRLPQYLFSILDELKAQAIARGEDVIDLGMGNPDLKPPKHVVDELVKQVKKSENHRYSKKGEGVEETLHQAVADWYRRKYSVVLDPKTEVLPLIGSKEGIAHLSMAFLNHDDIAIVPNPTYPVHFNGIILAGGILYSVPITTENNYLPDLHSINKEVLKMAKMLFISYPHNPTAAVANRAFFEGVVNWAKKYNIMVIHDFAYSDFVFEGERSVSFMEIPGAKEVGIEFHTLSKSYSLPGIRLGFAVGNRDILAALAKTKNYVDFGLFKAVQLAAAKALTGPQECVTETIATYKRRRDVFVKGLQKIGWEVAMPKATFYVWAKIPMKFAALTSLEFATLLMEQAGVLASPGSGFGEYGEGYLRFALVEPESRLAEAVRRIERVLQMED
jgi:alanine-synthesizing transaminase